MPRLPTLPHRLAAALLALGVPAAAVADCTLVFGQGRAGAAADADEARAWDEVNRAFNAGVARALAGGGRTVPVVARTETTDAATAVRAMLRRAGAEGCGRVVETTVFPDHDAGTLVARVREYPLSGGGTLPRIGAPRLHVERQFELTPATLDRVRPGELGARMGDELAEHRESR